MAEVIVSINCYVKDSACVASKLAIAQTFSAWVHLDIADGVFTFHKSWNEPGQWSGLCMLPTEVHLMVEDPLSAATLWNSVPNVKRFIVHAETVQPATFHALQEKVRGKGKSVMLALNPETPVDAVKPYVDKVLQFQVLAVHPGLSGQKFLPLVLDKIAWLRSHVPNAIIEVDGGITPETARLARSVGADILVSEHYIFGSPDPAAAYRELTAKDESVSL
jgi:ribulose-phosphate 3-epimerase